MGYLHEAFSCHFAEHWNHDRLVSIASWTSTTLQLATVIEPIHAPSTLHIRGSFRVMWPLMKRLKRRLHWKSEILQRASQHYACMECLGRCECDAKEGMVALFVHRELTPLYRLHSRKVSLDLVYESAGLLTHLPGQVPSPNAWQGIETAQWWMTLRR